MCSVLLQSVYSHLDFFFLLFYGKKVGQLSEANSRIQKKQTQMSKKPTTNEKLQFALTHTPAPQSCQIEISRHSWTPPHGLRLPPTKTTALNGTFWNPRNIFDLVILDFLIKLLSWWGSRTIDKITFKLSPKKRQAPLFSNPFWPPRLSCRQRRHLFTDSFSETFLRFKCVRFYNIVFIYFLSLLS